MTSCKQHTKAPTGYIEWDEWAAKKSRRHYQVKCDECGRYKIWRRKSAAALTPGDLKSLTTRTAGNPDTHFTPGDTKRKNCETCKGGGQIGVYEGPEGYEQLDVDTCPDCDGTGVVVAAALTPGDNTKHNTHTAVCGVNCGHVGCTSGDTDEH